MGTMPVFWRKHDVTTLIADEVFIVWRNQEELAFTKSPYAAFFGQIELPAFPLLHVNAVAKECNAFSTVADVES